MTLRQQSLLYPGDLVMSREGMLHVIALDADETFNIYGILDFYALRISGLFMFDGKIHDEIVLGAMPGRLYRKIVKKRVVTRSDFMSELKWFDFTTNCYMRKAIKCIVRDGNYVFERN